MGSSLAGGGSMLNNVLAHWCELKVFNSFFHTLCICLCFIISL